MKRDKLTTVKRLGRVEKKLDELVRFHRMGGMTCYHCGRVWGEHRAADLACPCADITGSKFFSNRWKYKPLYS